MTGFFFVHGWGFDAGIWRGVHAALGQPRALFADRGYFGEPVWPQVEGPVIAVGHSLGALHLLRDPPRGCAGLVAVNGFDRFAANKEDSAVPRRVVERMIARFNDDPVAVLADFRTRAGTDTPAPGNMAHARLLADLGLLRDADERAGAAKLKCPVLVLHGDADAILPLAMRDAVFAGAERRTLAGQGHLLPWHAAEWCARQIGAFAARIAQ